MREHTTVLAVDECRLEVDSDGEWVFAQDHAREIDAHWEARRGENPEFFNGTVYLAREVEVEERVFSGSLFATDFKSYLYWREGGYSGTGVFDVFGSALVISADGAVLLGRQGGRNMNSGLAYCPGGLIDPRDVRPGGAVDILGNVRRELREETGLGGEAVTGLPGFLITCSGPQISIAVSFRSPLEAEALKARILEHFSRDARPELEDIIVIRSLECARSVAMPKFMLPLLASYFTGRRQGLARDAAEH